MKVFLNMVGCRLNQAEIEHLALSLTESGVEVVSTLKKRMRLSLILAV